MTRIGLEVALAKGSTSRTVTTSYRLRNRVNSEYLNCGQLGKFLLKDMIFQKTEEAIILETRKVKILFPIKDFDYHNLTPIFFLQYYLCCFIGAKSFYFRYVCPMVRDI